MVIEKTNKLAGGSGILEISYKKFLVVFYVVNIFLPILFTVSNFFSYIDTKDLRKKKTISFFIVSLIYVTHLIYFFKLKLSSINK